MNAKRTPRAGHSNLPVPKASKGSPGNAKSSLSKGGPHTRSAEDIPRRVQLSVAGGASPQRRAISPGNTQRKGLATPSSPYGGQQNGQTGVRYITEDLIRKMCKEENLEVVTTLNLTLTKGEGGKKIKYIENLDKLKRLQVLNLSNNILEKVERLDKLLKLKELNISDNCIVKIEGLENLTNLQVLNLTGNLIEHIPIWMGKRLKSLRAFHIGRNRLESLSELAKLKPLPDLTQLTVAENPLAEFNHCRSYLVFHLRTLEIIDGQAVNDRERQSAKDRFEQDEVERLEKQLESEEAKFRRLEEDHNRSKQERSHLSATEDDLRHRERSFQQRLDEMEREMETKNDILKKKTSELNKACEKHYQLEQELAFYKIDSKFDSLGRGPEQSLDEMGDESGLLGESPYIGRARYKANKFANESNILSASPSQVHVQSVPQPVRADVKMEINNRLDNEIQEKQSKVAKAEDRLKRLSNDLQATEDKLKKATKDLKNIGDSALQEKEEQKTAVRQKMARKMRTVNEMKDSATQIEEELDKTRNSLHQNKLDMTQLKDQLGRLDSKDPNYRRVYGEMVDKEQQINESNQMYGQLQDQLELMLDTIAKETNDIKKLEQQLNDDKVESNDSLREELDDIVGGLQTYLAQVQTKAAKKEKEFDFMLREKEGLQEKVRKLETELSVLDSEAGNLRDMERRYQDMESSMLNQEDMNQQLQDQIHRSQRQDTQNQDYLESKELEVASLKKALKDLEQKAKDPDFIQKHWSNSTSIQSDNSGLLSKLQSDHSSILSNHPYPQKEEDVVQQHSVQHIECSVPGIIPHDKLTHFLPIMKSDKGTKTQSKEEEVIRKHRIRHVECSIPGIIPHDKLTPFLPLMKNDSDKKKQSDKHTMEKQLQTEKAKAIEGDRRSKEAQKKDDEVRKLMSQLETVKAQNVTLRDRMEQDTQTLQSRLQETTPNSDIRRRLKDLSQNLKQNKVQIEPEGEKDVLGKTFKDLQGFVHDKFNKSMKEADQSKSRLDKTDQENQSLREQLQRLEGKLNKRDDKSKNDKIKAKEENKTNLEEIKRQNEEIMRLRNALKEAKNRSKQGKGQTKMVHAPDSGSEFSRRSSLNSEEKFLFDELQNELLTLKRAMRNKEEDASKKLLDAETEAAMLEQNLHDQEESYQNEIDRLKDHMEMQKERQEARMQVIATDLDQAQQVADFLQRMLDEREQQLHGEVQQVDINNQMITTQEDELSKLYDILETQREELNRLNSMLDGISGQGGSLGTSGADDELWRLRQEVNNLKETLAMQSAYVQTMPPPSTSAGVQASTGTGTQYYLTDQSQAAGPVYRPLLSQYQEQPLSMVPPVPRMASMGTSYAPPGGFAPRGVGVGVGVGAGVGGGISGGFASGGSPVGTGSPDMIHSEGGTEQRHVKTPPGGRPSGGRSRPSQSPIRRHADRGADAEGDGISEHSGRRSRDSRGRRKERGRDRDRSRGREQRGGERNNDTDIKSGFEPVHRPQPFKPLSSGPVNVYSSPDGIVHQTGPVLPPGVQMTGGQMSGHGMMVPAAGPGQTAGPFGGSVSPQGTWNGAGVPMATSNYQTCQTFPTGQTVVPNMMMQQPSSILKHPGIAPVAGPPGTNPQGYMIPPGYTIPPPPGASAGVPIHSTGAPGGAGTQTSGYGSVQQATGHAGPGYGSSQSQTPGHAGNQTSGYASLPTHPHGPSVAMGNTPGTQGSSAFTAPAQALAYNSGRVFLPAYPTSPSRPAGRVYYKGQGGGPGGGGGGAPPPPPPPGGYSNRYQSPERTVKFLPMEPLAQGTPITGHSLPRTAANVSIPSPIRPVARDQSPTRAAPRTMAQTAGGNDDTYLFCNVPEHHDLEDYIAELQEKLKKLKARIANEQELQAATQENSDYHLIKRLQGELGERRDELEGLDLAIERQQKNLRNLKEEEHRLHFERQAARDDLEFEKDQTARRKRKVRMYADDEDIFDEMMDNSRKKMMRDEIKCLEHTLAKRKAQLREADRLLKECNTDLKCARDEARETVREYDKASVGLESTVKETGELEKRANLAGVELIKATEKLSAIRREIKDYDSRRAKQERLLKDVTQLITKRDSEFKDLDGRSKSTQQNLTRLQAELTQATKKERDTVAALRDSEDILAKRRNEIARMRDQIDQQKHELEKVDHMMGKKRTELQFLTESLERKQGEINQLIRETESELSSNKRELKESRELLRSLEVQRGDLNSQIKSKRTELQKIKDEIDTDDGVLQKLVNTVNKHKSDLKHTFEMQRLEQTELDNLKSQHAQRLADLEKTQRELLDEKNALEQLNSDVNKKTSELERVRGCVERDRQDGERLAMEKQSYEDRITTMTREKEMLEETYKTLDTKIAHLRRSQNTMEEKVDSTTRHLETLEVELQRREREMTEMDREKSHLQKDLQNLKHNIKDGKSELKILKDHVKDAENKIKHMEQELRDTNLQRDEAKLEMERLNEGIRQSRLTHDDCLRQQRQREEELQDLIRTMDEREIEYQETRKSLNKVRKEVEKEESKLSKLVSTADIELQHIRTDLNAKQSELSQATVDIYNLKKEAEKMELDEQKLSECESQIRELKQEVQDRNEEKNELAKALTRSYEELQKLRTESAQEQERLTMDRMELENTLRDLQDQLEHAKKEMQQMQKRSSSQVTELQVLAEEQFNRANKLTDELNRMKVKKTGDQPQTTLSDVTNQNTVIGLHDNKPSTPTEQTKKYTHGIQMTRSRDKGQFPARSGSPGNKFRDYLDLASTSPGRDAGFPVYDTSIKLNDSSFSVPDSGLSLPGIETNVLKSSSSLVRYPNRDSGSYVRNRSTSPPYTRDKTVTHDKNRDTNLSSTIGLESNSFSLPGLPVTTSELLDRGLSPPPVVTKPSLVTEPNKYTTQTDLSSTITTLSSPPTTQRDPLTLIQSGGNFVTGLSPPVRDSGAKVTDLSLPTSARDKRLEFDLGFLDILTVDSNSSIVDPCSTGRLTDRQSMENKENVRVNHVDDQRKADSLRDKLAKEQEHLRKQLQDQMQRHADAMEHARLQSEGTIENLRKKLNTLQDVLVTTPDITSPTLRRARSRSAGLITSPERQRSPSPGYHRRGYLAQRPRSRSRSEDRLASLFPERDILTV